MLTRVERAEQALALPGKQALVGLLALKRDIQVATSSLQSIEGLTPLTAAELPQQNVTMQSRRRMIDIGERLRAMDLFNDLSVAEATVLGTFMEREEVVVGELVVRRGDAGNALFVIESGQAEVRRAGPGGEAIAATLGPGDYFGEVALVTGAERIADVVAITPMALMRLSKDDYERYLVHTTEVEQRLTHAAMLRFAQRVTPVQEVPTSDVFSDLTAADASVLGSFMERQQVGAGEVIVRRGDPGDALFLIESGQAEAHAPGPDGRDMVFGAFGPGQYFGEVALTTGVERIADVVAVTPMSLVRLSREGYERYLTHAPERASEVARTAAIRATEHLRKMTPRTPEPPQ
jgi:cAMP-dependent protein kinase regulator